MKNIALILSCIVLLSCKEDKKIIEIDDKPQVNVTVTNSIPHEVLKRQVDCNENTYIFNIPIFNSNTDADLVLNNSIKGLITKNFIDVTYNRDAPLKSLVEMFLDRRARILCKEKKEEGLLSVDTSFITDTDKFISYELEYVEGKEKGRLLKTFLKPDLKEIHLSDVIQENKKQDVLTIFNANLQQAVANLVTEIPTGEVKNEFMDYVRNTAFTFDTKDFETSGLAFDFKGETTKKLRLSKNVNLPEKFQFLNNTIIIEIDAYQLSHYLDLSRVID
ncbi:hypothetical protein LX97_00379 [Nonlabens dokdonensis]|uniref:Lipoprotein n=2 Tax=Nonlabens dokdonensis TaxID=328515 RepID=L7W7C2_NONDD|nr:hypothetical protein [Nonlabens dokdonensis]AGC75691.1 hypothetical protein DDD_0564 [Nonlabens dokdonensis DSW-6]PZX43379.1 hypothetical protein LX97_00379 [Nonlabens dokdonensis]